MRHGALALALLPLAGGCRRGKPLQVEEPVQRLEGLRLSQSTLGRPGWDLRAQSAHLSDGDRVAVLTEPTVSFYEKRKEVSTVTARAGLVRTDTYDVTLSSDVVVRSIRDQSTLKTQQLRYSSQKKKFVTDRDVLVERPGGTLRGKGLEASPDLSDIRIFKQRTVLQEGVQ